MNIVQEGYFHVPESVYRDITEYFKDAYRAVKINNIKKIGSKNFPIKNFPIDFKGTRFEFLNKLTPQPSIDVQLTTTEKSFYNNEDLSINKGYIQLGLGHDARALYEVIEHEMTHFVQYLIQKHRQEKTKNSENLKRLVGHSKHEEIAKKQNIGGLPPKKYIDRSLSVGGRAKFSRKRVKHGRRPIEYYPDVLSTIRELHYLYWKENHENPDWKKMENSSEKKKEFFLKFYKKVEAGEDYGKVSTWIFKTFKNISKEFYYKMLKIVYTSFVNQPRNFNPEEIKDLMDHIETKKKEAPESDDIKSYESYVRNRQELSIYRLDFGFDLLNDLPENVAQKTEDGITYWGEVVASAMGLRENSNDQYNLPVKTKNIITIFKRLKAFKLRMTPQNIDIESPKDNPLTEEDITAIFDNAFLNLKLLYLHTFTSNDIPDALNQKFREMVDDAYNK